MPNVVIKRYTVGDAVGPTPAPCTDGAVPARLILHDVDTGEDYTWIGCTKLDGDPCDPGHIFPVLDHDGYVVVDSGCE